MGATDPSEDSSSERITSADHEASGDEDDAAVVDGEERVDVVWFPGDDDHVVVVAGQGDRAVNFHRYGRVGVAALGALFATLGVFVVHGVVTANTSLPWPVSAVVVAAGALAVAAYGYWRYDPPPSPEVVARDEPAASARDEFDFEE